MVPTSSKNNNKPEQTEEQPSAQQSIEDQAYGEIDFDSYDIVEKAICWSELADTE